MAVPDGIAPPGAKFNFWKCVVDLARSVANSKARGLKVRLFVALSLVLIGKWTGVVGPLLIQHAIDKLNRGRAQADATFFAFGALVVGWVLLRFVAGAAPYLRDAVFTPVSQEALARSATEAFAHALSLSVNFHQSKQTGALSRVIDRGSRSVDFLLRSVVFNLGPTLLELGMAAYVLTARFSWDLACVAIITIATYMAFTFTISDWRIRHRRELNDADADAAGLAVDALMNYETIKTFGAENRLVFRYKKTIDRYVHAAIVSNNSLQILNAIQASVLNVGLLVIILLAGWDVLHGRMSLGGVTACILIIQQVYSPLFTLGFNYREIRQSFIDMEKMLELLDVKPDVVESINAKTLPSSTGQGAELVFENVCFRHAGRSIGLEDINFMTPPGTTTALVGSSGAGKTTIVRLIMRLIDPNSGNVKLDGVSVRDIRLGALRSAVALVPQDVALFNDTLFANIAFSNPDAAEEEVWAAAESAELAQFIVSLPERLNTVVGERGLKLSGGERQRVGLARALLANPRLLVLDEATSALDGPTEAAIQATLRKVRRGRSVVVVAHRLSTIVDADQILVIRHGQIVERGDHASLLECAGEYSALWKRQTRSEERSGLDRLALTA